MSLAQVGRKEEVDVVGVDRTQKQLSIPISVAICCPANIEEPLNLCRRYVRCSKPCHNSIPSLSGQHGAL